MKVLVLCADYPNLSGRKAMNYVHVRNKYYKERGIIPVVVNFASTVCYVIDDIKVITYKHLKKSLSTGVSYDCLICHAPNIRNHYRFLRKYQNRFKKLIFVFHGHEIVRVTEVYPSSYKYIKQTSFFVKFAQNVYDTIKLAIWRKYFPSIIDKSHFVFVSKTLYKDFRCYVGKILKNYPSRIHIIPNSVGKTFADNRFDETCDKRYDFITIRNNMDSSVYCMDIITELARQNPQFSFLIIGRGSWFKYNEKPDNIVWVSEVLEHAQLLSYIDKSKFALMPTRRDSQGVMSCELLTYGIPVITSDIEVCKEITDGFSNYVLIENDPDIINLKNIYYGFERKRTEKKEDKYLFRNTTELEVQLLMEK